MYKPQNIIPAAQDLAREWVKHATDGTSAQTDAVVRWALARINHADVPSVVHGVILTLTGNKKAAKEAQRTAAKAVTRTTQALKRNSRQRAPRLSGWVIGLLIGAVAGAGAVLAWRMMVPPGEPEPVKETQGQPPVPPVP
ncbi:hypothetical protein [Paenarthrobacter nitroguajacolicus]|uniref:hypothetical protein n=1 Tax=Paenarthrobacter nitroguajacolicus TaxID=211146 RepID=UPI00285638D5|nr:hypothetical protein [Paenarthrobacter nitroguajacolicus]MDR6638924.1 hypothetical protein [Paenarthrobacter nitroguajacolicus]